MSFEWGFASKLLFSRVKQRGIRNDIVPLKDDLGLVVFGQANIQNLINTSLKNIYKSNILIEGAEDVDLVLRQLDLPSLSSNQSNALLSPISFHEVEKVVICMKGSSTLGPDGITTEFLKVHWSLIGDLVFQAVSHPFSQYRFFA